MNAGHFIVRFQFDVRVWQTAQRASVDELAAYTLQSGLITEESIFVLESYFKSCNRLVSRAAREPPRCGFADLRGQMDR